AGFCDPFTDRTVPPNSSARATGCWPMSVLPIKTTSARYRTILPNPTSTTPPHPSEHRFLVCSTFRLSTPPRAARRGTFLPFRIEYHRGRERDHEWEDAGMARVTTVRIGRMDRPAVSAEAQRLAVLRRLRGRAAEAVARDAGIGTRTLERWRRDYFRSKLPTTPGAVEETVGLVRAPVRIRRDSWGIAHVQAESEADAFFGLGYAMAQERLWQIDFQRRLVRGELAAVLGRRFLESDRAMRILGVGVAGDRAWESAPEEVRRVLEALAAGIDRWTEQVGAKLPVEFELLGYAPRPWNPSDSIAIWKHRWWTLTGRLELTVVADAARRLLPPDLAEAFFGTELADETIVPEKSPRPHPNGHGGGALDEGRNNWAAGGARTTTGAPVLCSDPHTLFAAPSQWVEAQVTCPSFDAAGAFYIGTPGLYLGRNRDVAWGLTNHAISVRDLYREETSPDRPGQYRDGATWRPFETERQMIVVADGPNDMLEIRRTTR